MYSEKNPTNWYYFNFSFYFCFQRQGLEKNLGMGKLNDFEKKLVEAGLQELLASIKKGEQFATES